MENSQIISIGISIASVLMAFMSVVLALWSAKIAKSQKLINQNMQALEIYREIGKNKEKIFSYYEKLSSVDSKQAVSKMLESLYADSRNFYEILCYNYVNGGIDKQYFKEMLKDNLKNFIEHSINEEFYTEPTTKYTYTIKVYKEFK